MLQPVCSDSAASVDEPLIGTAPHAVGWVCLEQDGPWGRKAWTQSHLDAELGETIEQAAADHRIRPVLIRRPGPHPDLHDLRPRTVLVSYGRPGASWLLRGTVIDPAVLLELRWSSIAAGDVDAVQVSAPWLAPDPQPHLLVCTNGARDTCCARLGRPVVAATAARMPDQVWEVTHTSGHRFSPTTVLLPSGYLHGRILDGTTVLTAAAADRLAPGSRGRSSWPTEGQVAEGAVRDAYDVDGLDDLVVEFVGTGPALWSVRHRDGRAWTVTVETFVSGERAESCGKELKPVTRYRTRITASP